STPAITKDNAGGPILVIYDGGHFISANDNDLLVHAGLNKLARHGQGIKEARTSSRNIETVAVFSPYIISNYVCGCRKWHIRGDSSTNNKINIFRIGVGLFQ